MRGGEAVLPVAGPRCRPGLGGLGAVAVRRWGGPGAFPGWGVCLRVLRDGGKGGSCWGAEAADNEEVPRWPGEEIAVHRRGGGG